jgi:rare lipoprotein A
LFKTKILPFLFFLNVQLVLATSVANVGGTKGDPAETNTRYVEEGEASWYGPGFDGRKTASGERFNTHEMTAAHKTLPFGTLLKVTNLENNLWTIVKVNDRGPYVGGRIIDLSNAAKLSIEMGGTAPVRIEVISEDEQEMLKNGIDPSEKIDVTGIDTTQFNTTELLDKNVEADSKVFVSFESEDGTTNNFQLNKNLKTGGNLKIKVITPKSEDDNQTLNLYQSVENADSLIRFYDLSNQPAVVKGYSIEAGTYSDKSLADRRIGGLIRDGFTKVYLEEIISQDPATKISVTGYRVLVGLYDHKKSEKKVLSSLTKLKYLPKLIKIGE